MQNAPKDLLDIIHQHIESEKRLNKIIEELQKTIEQYENTIEQWQQQRQDKEESQTDQDSVSPSI